MDFMDNKMWIEMNFMEGELMLMQQILNIASEINPVQRQLNYGVDQL